MSKLSISLPNLKGTYSKNKQVLISTKNEILKIILKKNDVSSIYYKNKENSKFQLLNKNYFKKKIIGKKNFKRKVVHFLYNKSDNYKLRAGITYHLMKGSWSSLPHKFENKLERGFEEFFFYLLKNPPFEAIQVGKGVWHNFKKVNSAWKIRNKTFSQVPMGYHPVAGLPNVQVAYIWAYIAKYKSWEKI